MIESQVGEQSKDRHSGVVEWFFAWVSTGMQAFVDLCRRDVVRWRPWLILEEEEEEKQESQATRQLNEGLCFAKARNFFNTAAHTLLVERMVETWRMMLVRLTEGLRRVGSFDQRNTW